MSDQATIEVTCTRCSGTRSIPNPYIPLNARGWVTGPARDLREPGYTCMRCTKTKRGDLDVKDPIASEAAVQAAQARADRRRIAMTSPQTDPGATRSGQEDSAYGLR